MATQTSPPRVSSDLENRVRALESRHLTTTIPTSSLPENHNNSWFTNLLQGVTLAALVGFAFWLGTLSTSIKQSSERVDKIYGVVLESKDSMSARLNIIETKLDTIDKKLTELAATPVARQNSRR
jgi:hypothetical protein